MHRVSASRVEVEPNPGAGIDEVVTLWLEPVDEPLDDFGPGQFAMLWAPGVGEVPISLSGADGGLLGFTIRSVGATTASLCTSGVGAVVGVRGPFGRGWSEPAAGRRSLVVAGGIGLAPLRMHIDRLVRSGTGGAGPSPPVVVVGARTAAEILYRDDLDRWGGAAEVHVTVDRPTRGWAGDVGLVTATMGRLALDPGVSASLCGPEIMMRLAAGDLIGAGVPPGDLEVSMERSMDCAIAHCGRCQIGPVMVCRDGPVFRWSDAQPLMEVRRW